MQNIHIEQHSRKGRPYSYIVLKSNRILLITTSKRIALDYRARLETVEYNSRGVRIERGQRVAEYLNYASRHLSLVKKFLRKNRLNRNKNCSYSTVTTTVGLFQGPKMPLQQGSNLLILQRNLAPAGPHYRRTFTLCTLRSSIESRGQEESESCSTAYTLYKESPLKSIGQPFPTLTVYTRCNGLSSPCKSLLLKRKKFPLKSRGQAWGSVQKKKLYINQQVTSAPMIPCFLQRSFVHPIQRCA